MSGHSKWSTIKRAKGAADVVRGLTFTKLAKAITIAAKLGGSGDPDSNPRLRMAMDEARGANMPKDNMQRAIERGLGKEEGHSLEEVLYEGFGTGKIAFIVEAVTDNKMRTLQEIKNLFDKNGGALAQSGAVTYMFERLGEIRIKQSELRIKNKEEEMLELIDLGVDDVEDFLEDNTQKYLVYTEATHVAQVGAKITQAGYTVESQQIIYKPTILMEIADKEAERKVMDFADKLEGLSDVQKVWMNF